MKTFIYFCLFYLACCVGYYSGKYKASKQSSKDYEVATIMTTCCNNMVDNLGTDAEEIYYDYIDNLDTSNLTITKEDIAKYNS